MAFGAGHTNQGVGYRVRKNPDAGQSAADDLFLLRERLVGKGNISADPFNLAANASQKLDYSQIRSTGFVATVTSGYLYVYLGDFTHNPSSPPHFVFSVGNSQQIMLPPGYYVFTLQASPAGTASGIFMPVEI